MTVYFEQDRESGKIEERYPDQEFLNAVEEHDPASTSEVADAVGCTRRNALNRLKTLEDGGQIKAKDAGGSFVWLLTD
jgi:DNA-binding Lrp family transcriptional regulator